MLDKISAADGSKPSEGLSENAQPKASHKAPSKKVYRKTMSETLVLHDGNNGEWWFMDARGTFVTGYFSSPIKAHMWANDEGFELTDSADCDSLSQELVPVECVSAIYRIKQLPRDRILAAVNRETGSDRATFYVDDIKALMSLKIPVGAICK